MKVVKISEAEMEVMEQIWTQNQAVTPKEVLSLLSQRKDWKYSTIRTFLSRLVDKGLLSCKKGRVNVYSPLLTKEEYKRCETKEFLDTLHQGSLRSILTSLCKEDISDEKLDELLKEIDNS